MANIESAKYFLFVFFFLQQDETAIRFSESQRGVVIFPSGLCYEGSVWIIYHQPVTRLNVMKGTMNHTRT